MKKLLTALLMTATFLNAQSIFNINLNSTDLELGVDKLTQYSGNTKIYSSFAVIKAEDENDDEQTMFEGEMMIVGLTSLPGFSAGMGVKAIHTKIDVPKKELSATGIGIKVKALYTLPLVVKSYATASYTYGPSALTFSDLDKYYETRIQGDFEIIDGGMVYVGYRNMEIDFEDRSKKYEFNDSVYFGVKFVYN